MSTLSWHPDKNQGCSEARKRFQRVKDAFDEIKRRQLDTPRSVHQTQRGYAQSNSANYSYRYTPRQNHNAYGSASTFNGYGRSYTYHRARSRSNPRGAWEEAAQTMAQARLRMARPIGVVGCLIAASFVLSSITLSTELVWRVNNRGKSFEDMVNSLDTSNNSRVPSRRGLEHRGRHGTSHSHPDTKKPQES